MLLTSEIAEIKAELGYNILSSGAVPWVDIVAIFEQVIQPNVSGGAATTSATVVTATGSESTSPVTLTLADITGFTAGDRAVVDVDARQEIATVQSITGSTVVLMLKLAHTGTYPVTVEGPETVVRSILRSIRETKQKLFEAHGTGALKAVDEVSFYEADGQTLFGVLGSNLTWWREELASALGIRSAWSRQAAAGSTISVY